MDAQAIVGLLSLILPAAALLAYLFLRPSDLRLWLHAYGGKNVEWSTARVLLVAPLEPQNLRGTLPDLGTFLHVPSGGLPPGVAQAPLEPVRTIGLDRTAISAIEELALLPIGVQQNLAAELLKHIRTLRSTGLPRE